MRFSKITMVLLGIPLAAALASCAPRAQMARSEAGPPHMTDRGLVLSRADVMAAQEALKNKGHYAGRIDGDLDSETRQALSDFQRSAGIQITGELTGETASRLGIEVGQTLGWDNTQRFESRTSPEYPVQQ